MTEPHAAPQIASLSAMYQETLLAHYRAPHNRRELPDATARAARRNPLCGDALEVAIRVDAPHDVSQSVSHPVSQSASEPVLPSRSRSHSRVQSRLDTTTSSSVQSPTAAPSSALADVAFTGRGCSIAVASASMMTDATRGLGRDEALRLVSVVEAMLTQGAPALQLPESLTALRAVAPFPGRHGCASMPWLALRDALQAIA